MFYLQVVASVAAKRTSPQEGRNVTKRTSVATCVPILGRKGLVLDEPHSSLNKQTGPKASICVKAG